VTREGEGLAPRRGIQTAVTQNRFGPRLIASLVLRGLCCDKQCVDRRKKQSATLTLIQAPCQSFVRTSYGGEILAIVPHNRAMISPDASSSTKERRESCPIPRGETEIAEQWKRDAAPRQDRVSVDHESREEIPVVLPGRVRSQLPRIALRREKPDASDRRLALVACR
jgi:hypothetical protein